MRTLLPTLLIELLVGGMIAHHLRVPLLRFAGIAILVNAATQALLWAVLVTASPHYWPALLPAELVIWWIESACFSKAFKLERKTALALGFAMNATSFGVGLLLPI